METIIILAIWYALVYPSLKELLTPLVGQLFDGKGAPETWTRYGLLLTPFFLLVVQWILALEWIVPVTFTKEMIEVFLNFGQLVGIGMFVFLAYLTGERKGWHRFIRLFLAFFSFVFSAYLIHEANPIIALMEQGNTPYVIGYIYFGGMTGIVLLLVMYGYYRYFDERKGELPAKASTLSTAVIGMMLIASLLYYTIGENGGLVISVSLFIASWIGISTALNGLSKGWRRAMTFVLSVVIVYLLTELYIIYNFALWWNS